MSLSEAFSERYYELVQHTVVGDSVWGHYLFTGVHTGAFFGHEPTGKQVNIYVMDIVTIKDNQIIEHWGVPDRRSTTYRQTENTTLNRQNSLFELILSIFFNLPGLSFNEDAVAGMTVRKKIYIPS